MGPGHIHKDHHTSLGLNGIDMNGIASLPFNGSNGNGGAFNGQAPQVHFIAKKQ